MNARLSFYVMVEFSLLYFYSDVLLFPKSDLADEDESDIQYAIIVIM